MRQQLEAFAQYAALSGALIDRAKRHFVDHATYDTTSILSLIEKRFGLRPLSTRDAAAAPLLNAFDFSARHGGTGKR